MLQQLQEEETRDQSAAQVRVTPEELAQAASTLEIRHLAEQRRQAETISLGDAAHELGLNATPAQLLAEVEAERARRSALEREQKQALRKRRRTAGIAGAAALGVIGVLGLSVFNLSRQLHDALRPLPTLPIQGLAAIPDNVPVHCDLPTLSKLAEGSPPSDVFVDSRANTPEAVRTGAFDHEWTLIKSGGKIQVEAWATAENALKAANGQDVSVFSNRPAFLPASNTVSVRIPIDRFAQSYTTDRTIKGDDAKEGAAGVLYETNLQSIQTVLKNKIGEARGSLSYSDPNTHQQLNDLDVEIKNGEAHLTGYVSREERRLRAAKLANEVIQKHNLPLKVVNDIGIMKLPPEDVGVDD